MPVAVVTVAFIVFTPVDRGDNAVVPPRRSTVARQVLDEKDAGLYAAGLIMTKVMLFLPQFIVVIAFPDMASPERRQRALRRSLVAIGVLLAANIGWRLIDGQDVRWAYVGVWALLAVACGVVGGLVALRAPRRRADSVP